MVPERPTIAAPHDRPPDGDGALHAHVKPVPRWHLHRRLYDWMLGFAHHRHASLALFLFSFAEASFFPLPPDILQIPLTLGRRSRAWWYAAVSTAGSVAGGVAGYFVGWFFWKLIAGFFRPDAVEHVRGYFDGFGVLVAGSIVVHPYKLFTIAAGVLHVNLGEFLLASLIGRGLRFFLVGWLLWQFGAPVRALIDRYFHILSVVLFVLIVASVAALKFL
ncbi:MAG: DedA family protein [Phycisphaerales bacterium]|nr:DedA family protein [Phycisphaerales bacterium]